MACLRFLPVLEDVGLDGVPWERVTRPRPRAPVPRATGVVACWRFIVMKRPSGFHGVICSSSLEEASWACANSAQGALDGVAGFPWEISVFSD